MKKFLLLAAIAVLAPTLASAQSAAIGFKGGVNFSTFGGDDASFSLGSGGFASIDVDFSNRTAFVAGGFITMQLDDYFALQPELLYVSRGAQVNSKGNALGIPFSSESTITINYLEIPLLAKLTLPTGTTVTPFLYVGPSLAVKAGEATSDGSESDDDSFFGSGSDFDSDIKDTDFGLNLGAGLGLNLGGGMLMFDARYTLGLSTIVKEQEDENGNNEDQLDLMNRSLSLSIGFAFFL